MILEKIKSSIIGWFMKDHPIIDVKSKTILVPDGYSLVVQGNLHIKSTGHMILESGKTLDENGLVHGIWLNPDFDNNGNLISYDPPVIEGNSHGCQHRSIE